MEKEQAGLLFLFVLLLLQSTLLFLFHRKGFVWLNHVYRRLKNPIMYKFGLINQWLIWVGFFMCFVFCAFFDE